jgi:hypothetical protein
VVPQEAQTGVGEDAGEGEEDEAEEHLAHGEEGGLVEDLLAGALVDEVQHLVRGHVAVSVGNRPLEGLKIHLPLHLAHHCHLWLGNHQVGRSGEPELLVDVADLVGEGETHEERGVVGSVDGADVLVEVDHVLVLGVEFAGWGRTYVQSLQLLEVK